MNPVDLPHAMHFRVLVVDFKSGPPITELLDNVLRIDQGNRT